jgi:hypothetical protein
MCVTLMNGQLRESFDTRSVRTPATPPVLADHDVGASACVVVHFVVSDVMCRMCWAKMCTGGIEPPELPATQPTATLTRAAGARSPTPHAAVQAPIVQASFTSICQFAACISAFESRMVFARSSAALCRSATSTVLTQRISLTPCRSGGLTAEAAAP